MRETETEAEREGQSMRGGMREGGRGKERRGGENRERRRLEKKGREHKEVEEEWSGVEWSE